MAKTEKKTTEPRKKRGRPRKQDNVIYLPAQQGLHVDLPGKITQVSMDFPANIEHGDWTVCGLRLQQIHDASNWWIGDWLNAGEQRYGEMYAQAASETNIPEDRLMILKHVALRVDPITRRKELSWSHHREVAKLEKDEQAYWLNEAIKNGWSVRELKEALRKKGRRNANKDVEEPISKCPLCEENEAEVRICKPCAGQIEQSKVAVG